MKNLLLPAAALALMAGNATAADFYRSIDGNGTMSGASSSGNYVVGYNPYYNSWNVFMESFIHDVASQTTEWWTEYSEDDLSVGGQFCGVSDSGIVCGVSKDMDNVITWGDFMDEFTGPTQVATLWENGERMQLPYGSVDPAAFEYIEDGTFARFISADGNVVVGFAGYGNGSVTEPCEWRRTDGGDWQMKKLPVPGNARNVTLYAMSADGSTILGGAYVDEVPKAMFWKDGKAIVVEGPENPDPDNFVSVQPMSVSPDGRYIVMSNNYKGVVYDITLDEYRHIPPFSDTDMMAMSAVVDNEGNVYSSYNGYPESHPFIYLYGSDRTLDLNYYIGIVSPGLAKTVSFSNTTQFVSVSADGTRLSGNTAAFGGTAWIMELNAGEVTVPEQPEFSYAMSRGLREVTLRWAKDAPTCGTYTLRSYNVMRNGTAVAEVAADKEELELTLSDQPEGYPSYTLVAVYEGSDGKTLESPVSNAASVAVAPDYGLPFFDGFDISLQTNYWTQTRDYGNPTQTVWSCFGGAGVQNGMGAYTTVSDGKPYSFSLESRPLDATEEDYVSVSFGSNHAMLNDNFQILDTDFISIEISTDMGDSWTTIRSWKLSDLAAGNWSFKSLDITDAVAGKIFKVRVRRHGEGNGMYIAGLDNFAVNTVLAIDAPEGLTGEKRDNGDVALLWKSLSGAFNLNKLGYMRTMNLSFGNEGREMIAVNRYTPSELSLFKGKYITSVSAPFNFDEWYEEVLGVNASAVIFEDGVIVREQEFDQIEYNAYNVLDLDEPYLIDGTKEVMVGIKIHDYDAEQWPLIAATADDFVKGSTDLYTEDGGKTWGYASEFFNSEDIRSYIIWDITAHVTDTPEAAQIDYGLLPLFYNVDRDGETANVVAIDGNASEYIDREGSEKSTYRVVAHGADGSISDFSNMFSLVNSGICSTMLDGEGMEYTAADGEVVAADNSIRMTVFAADGRAVRGATGNRISVRGLDPGIYLVVAETPDGMMSRKILVAGH